jgi:DNA-binding MarR family transcriptional regulator
MSTYVHQMTLPRVSFKGTLQVREQCLCLSVQRAARVLARQFDEALRPVGLSNGQFSLLMSLNRPKPPNMRSVAELLAMDRTTLTAALKTLKPRGLMTVKVDPSDGRNRLLGLTSQGRKLLRRAFPIWEREHRALEVLLGRARPGLLRRDLQSLVRAVE